MPRINSLNTFVLSSIINSAGGGGGGVDETLNYQGATMLFVMQGTAPTGWVKLTADTDYSLRCVTGSVSSGGTQTFSSTMTTQTLTGSLDISGAIGDTTLSSSQMASHTHTAPATYTVVNRTNIFNGSSPNACRGVSTTWVTGTMAASPTTPGTSGGLSHTHPMDASGRTSPVTISTVDLRVKYVEAILATRT